VPPGRKVNRAARSIATYRTSRTGKSRKRFQFRAVRMAPTPSPRNELTSMRLA